MVNIFVEYVFKTVQKKLFKEIHVIRQCSWRYSRVLCTGKLVTN